MTLIDIARPAPDVAILTLDRPERLNALSFALVEELHDALAAFERDNSCRVVILTGAGRGFCAGLDLKDPVHTAPTAAGLTGPAAGMRTQEYIASLVPRIQRLPQTVIAAINGPAFGGGLALAAACDIRIASTSARFGVQFVKIGISGCDIGISYTLPRIVGGGRAAELITTGREFDATEAERIGFVTRVAEDGELLDTATELAATLCNHSPFALAMTKQVLVANASAGSVDAAIALENRTQILAGTGGEFAEAVTAFAERRAPSWVH
ncbi:enoyl-CoA hydratase-related protein [Prescottella equi]|uniref:Enoyl-CoA hydratase/isomerase family protein n=1 Tax=Rhodococcus hoagii TaxID=43767 RepID=A0A9Q5F5C3_RHOHA|nr:enoyl-CoA hydratase-related protein [Prescottella equi]MBM4479257.1 enoyl-CoA hydratase/isomerase family protein [Prescottella equi]MBM4490875.1 enoyl-CoA hydratase/isomerase family protein [Prescottella equi]MBM4496119.1 enoyl-CoA hydratase/isomerase family protein [Prescottella equi]MBM4501829.1 enoyl-CoA hydratase/isomerase family protein [Prescottella equi]MBM4505591.1 enoyl-CoA hydratase/isomerase family protein [Prescottella equi]